MKIGIFNQFPYTCKTGLTIALARELSFKRGIPTLVVDCDPNYCGLSKSVYVDEPCDKKTMFDCLRKAINGQGFAAVTTYETTLIAPYTPTSISHILYGDIRMWEYDAAISSTRDKIFSGHPFAITVQSAFHEMIDAAMVNCGANIAILDVGGGFANMNRTILAGCDFIFVPERCMLRQFNQIDALLDINPDLYTVLNQWKSECEDYHGINERLGYQGFHNIQPVSVGKDAKSLNSAAEFLCKVIGF